MPAAVSVLFGAAFTIATAASIGRLLLRRLALRLDRADEWLLAFLTGAAVLSEFVFLLASVHLARTWVFLTTGIFVLLLAWKTQAFQRKPKSGLPALPSAPRWILITIGAAFTAIYFINAMAPEASPDGSTYHLGAVLRYFRVHGFERIPTNMYANLSQGLELLFLFAFSFGRHSAAALVHFAFLLCLTLLIAVYGRRIGHPAAGSAAAILFYCAPVVGIDGTIAYNDVALAAAIFACFYFLQLWNEQRDPKLLIPIGIFAGWSYGIKYTGFLVVPYACGFIFWKLWRARKPLLRPIGTVAGVAAMFILPWLAKNWILVANPLSPFGNRIFPNPYVHISFETEYSRFMRTYGLSNLGDLPLQLTVKGDALAGFFGPLFLLAPLGALALRFRAGRQVCLAALVFALPYPANIGARFLIPAAPFVSLAIALAFCRWTWLVMTLALAQAITCWPFGMDRYFGRNAWRLYSVPWQAALRLIPQEQFLMQRSAEYGMARLVQHEVPPGGKVFTFSAIADAYTDRTIVMRYEGALNERIGDMLWAAVTEPWQPSVLLKFQVQPQQLQKIRIVQTARSTASQWSVNELRIFDRGSELPRTPEWRLTAHPNPWDVQLAFDNNPATRWRTWQVAEPGMYLQIDFGRPQTMDVVTIETAPDSLEAKLSLEGMDASGHWRKLAGEPSQSIAPIHVNLRKAATLEMKSLGIRYIMVCKNDPYSDDFVQFAPIWGLRVAGVVGDAHLLYIE